LGTIPPCEFWFTCAAFLGTLRDAEFLISMDGRGRWMDNVFIERLWRTVKHEDVYLRCYENSSQVARRRRALLPLLQRKPAPPGPRIQSPGKDPPGNRGVESRDRAELRPKKALPGLKTQEPLNLDVVLSWSLTWGPPHSPSGKVALARTDELHSVFGKSKSAMTG
jgi:transposase InsO family protein